MRALGKWVLTLFREKTVFKNSSGDEFSFQLILLKYSKMGFSELS